MDLDDGRRKSKTDRGLREGGRASPMPTEPMESIDDVRCATCGRALDGDPDEDPKGDAGMPICGECERERNFFVMDAADGSLDGSIDG
jgi:hypothetical protein